MVGYYRRFFPHFSDIAAPLTALLEKKRPNQLRGGGGGASVPGRRRDLEFKERTGEGKGVTLQGNPTTEEETGEQRGTTEEDRFSGVKTTTEEETGIRDRQQGAPKKIAPQGE
ncbi:hypothetical protein NDU88_009269 [Pleurodeles waltl]|uniref:Uncharacterized protein n=1 Tax=Pleurodeles waltl TaxID=8319 RepID=A0AAV7NZ22_PLEWA|nr:hypothetical protein NDU88_009269 [Pleurodeles waltl]